MPVTTKIFSTGPVVIGFSIVEDAGAKVAESANRNLNAPRNSNGIYVIGFCETSPTIHQKEALHAGFNTLGGVTPYAYVRGGTQATIDCVFTKWDDKVVELLKRLATSSLSPITMSALYGESIQGSPLWFTLSLYIQFLAGATVRPFGTYGWVFPSVRVARIRRLEMGSVPEKVEIGFVAYRKWSNAFASTVREALNSQVIAIPDDLELTSGGTGGGGGG